jgi:hypothetical protein
MATRNRYAEIMSQYRQSQPYSFFGYPQSYTGGYDATAYTPAAAPVSRYEEIMAQPAMGGGGGRGTPEAPSAWSQMTPAERGAYYAANPTEGKIALGLQDLFGNVSLMGQAAKYFGGDGWYDSRLEKMGYDPEAFAYGPPDPNFSSQAAAAARSEALQGAIAAANAESGYVANPMSVDPAQAAQAQAQAQVNADMARMAANDAAAQASREASAQASLAPGAGSGGGGGNRDGGIGGSSPGDPGRGGGGAHAGGGYAKGGHVSMMHLQGPNPAGPDDGYAALKDGEYVINDKAVKKYGIELMEAINSGKISKGKLRGLLEM